MWIGRGDAVTAKAISQWKGVSIVTEFAASIATKFVATKAN